MIKTEERYKKYDNFFKLKTINELKDTNVIIGQYETTIDLKKTRLRRDFSS